MTYSNQGRFSNRLCEYCHAMDVIVTREYDTRKKTYEVVARESGTNKLHTCLGRDSRDYIMNLRVLTR